MPRARGFEPYVRLEDALALVCRDSGAAILDVEGDLPLARFGQELDGRAGCGALGVGQQGQEDLGRALGDAFDLERTDVTRPA